MEGRRKEERKVKTADRKDIKDKLANVNNITEIQRKTLKIRISTLDLF